MKKFLSLTLILLLIFNLALPVLSEDKAKLGKCGNVIDNTGRISQSDLDLITDYINKAFNERGYSLVIVYDSYLVEDDYERKIFTENYYENASYSDEGIMLYVGINSRTYDIYSCHKNKYSEISESELDKIDYYVYSALGNDQFSKAALLFAEYSYQSITSGDTEEYYMNGKTKDELIGGFAISFILALVVALIIVLIMKSNMKTIKPQRSAGTYIDRSTLRLKKRHDRFLYSTITKVRRDTDSSSGGGRSSSRSSGGSHRGGRF